MSRIAVAIVAALVLFMVPARVSAQFVSTASIEGTVTDESGGAMPGAAVTLTSPALQVSDMTAVTNAEGRYRFAQLPAGTYRLRYELSGFQPVIREGLTIGAGFAAKADVVLKIGSVQESITVSGASPIVDVSTTSGAQTLSPEMVNQLIPGSRMYGDMARMIPGLVSTSAPNIGRLGLGSSGGFNA
jgi:hypothetical protein